MVEKTYAREGVTVVWKAELCIHSARCVGALPKVFDPDRRPWIDVNAGEPDAIRAAVARCPSGALSLREPAGAAAAGPAAATAPASAVTVTLTPNGPLIVRGSHVLEGGDGERTEKSAAVAYCRCGGSARKPYCDGSHGKIGFKG